MRVLAATTDAIDPRELLKVLSDYKGGNFSARLPGDQIGTTGKIYDTLNDVMELNQRMAKELARVSTAVAKGDLSQGMALEIDHRPLTGEFLRTAKGVNTMVDQLSTFASEVTRVAREVGTEGTLGGQARVKGVAGTWKDLTDNVNAMANNLTGQVRNIVEVTTAVASGDLSRRITVDVRGEFLALKNTINTMIDHLGSFASEGTRVVKDAGADNTSRRQADEALLKAGALQSAIFNSANFSSIATDAKGVIQIFNVGAERMLGYTAAEVMNKITPADISDPQEVIARAKALSMELGTPITPGFEALVFKASRGRPSTSPPTH